MLAHVALRFDERMEKRTVSPCHADHGLVYRLVAVGIELHRGPDNVCGFCKRAAEKSHLVHGIEEFALGGLQSVYLRDSSRNDDAHGVRHIVALQRVGDTLLGIKI